MTDLGGTADERSMLAGFLDWQRAVTERKLDGLTREQAGRTMTPSGLSVLGVVQHLAWVERTWFRFRFAGEDVELAGFSGPPTERAPQFMLAADATVDSVLAFYRDEVERATAITDGASSLDDHAARPSPHYGTVSLRWILVHMIEETARHNGHLDLMRESIDGRTGD